MTSDGNSVRRIRVRKKAVLDIGRWPLERVLALIILGIILLVTWMLIFHR